jgi:hypothetical protein
MAKVPVSVEDVNAFMDYARQALGDDGDLKSVFERLAASVHPLVLGNAFRARAQIRVLGDKLLRNHMYDEKAVSAVLDFLCSDSGSHDYTINRREARDELGLPIAKPSQEQYETIKKIYDDFAAELELNTPYNANLILAGIQEAQYSHTRALVESADAGSHAFMSEGILTKQQFEAQPGVVHDAINDQRQYEGWRHRDA